LGGIPGNNGGSTLSTGQRPEGYGSQQNILSASKPAQQPQQSTKLDGNGNDIKHV
jgi:hypothetical protein